MSRAAGSKDYVSLAGGLITESSKLAFPEGATSGELNFSINKDGFIRKRRLGFSNLVNPFHITGTNPVIENIFYWRGPSLVVVIVKDDTPQTTVRFHAVDDDFSFISSVVISNNKVVTQVAETTTLLVITTDQNEDPILCEYDAVGKSINVSSVKLYIRDFELVDDGQGVSERIGVPSDNHNYNLLNAGWYQTKPDANDGKTVKQTLTAFFDSEGLYPSNADVPSVGTLIDEDGDTVFKSDEVLNADLGNSVAPRGHYVYDALDIDRTSKIFTPTADGVPSTTTTSLGTISLTGVSTYTPDDPTNTGNPVGGGGIPPFEGEFGEFGEETP